MREVILGHEGMVGSALRRAIPKAQVPGWRTDLRCHVQEHLIEGADVIYLCAARVGGIQRNINEPGQMIYDNLMIQANVIEAARQAGVKLVVFLGSSCIYPAMSSLLREEDLLGGHLEPTNAPYAVAKIAGIKMLEAYQYQYGMEFLAVMPCNLYGPGGHYDLEKSHFIPGMIRRFHEAKVAKADSVTLWGTGTPRRELMHVDDCARIIVELVRKGARGLINIGPGLDDSIGAVARLVHQSVEFEGQIRWDTSKPDGVARKLMDVSRMKSFGVEPRIALPGGLCSTYQAFLKENACV